MAQQTIYRLRGPNRRAHPLGVGLALGLTIGAALLAASPAAADTPTPTSADALTVAAYADPGSGLTGDCVGVSLDVTGVVDGVALQPVIATLNGPLDSVAAGDTVTGPEVGSIEATWGGSEWSYSGSCVTAATAGTYVWTVNDTNSDTGIDDTAYTAAMVTVTDPVVIVEPTQTDTDTGTGTSTTTSGGGSVQSSTADTTPRLAHTGVSAQTWTGIALVGGVLLLVGVLVTTDAKIRARWAREAFTTNTEEKK